MSASAPATTARFPWILLLPVLMAAGIAGAWLLWRALPPPPKQLMLAEHSALRLDLGQPDALIESASLAKLPRDLLRVPWLRDTLTEDFVFYYESNPDRLGITGALRRIAYEHELELSDRLIQELLDQPGEIALWRGRDGKLAHALLILRRGALAKLLEPLARVAADDRQLRLEGAIRLDGEDVPLYRLRYNHDRALLFAAHGDRMVVLSSPGLLLTDDGTPRLGRDAAAQLDAILGNDATWSQRFGLARRDSVHRLSISADYLALGYGQFIARLAALRFEMTDAGWQSYLALSAHTAAADLDFLPLWQAMPLGASACAAVPVATTRLQPLFERMRDALDPALAQRLQGPGALCWYGKSRLHTPLLVTRLAAGDTATADAQLQHAFESLIGSWEAEAGEDRYPVEVAREGQASLWTRRVSSSFGLHHNQKTADGEAPSYSHHFRVSLARHGDTLLFSLDDALVRQALATLDRRFPPLAEQLPRDRRVPVYLAPQSLAALLERETLSSLPARMEAVFHNAAQAHLLPKLRALGQHGNYALTLPADTNANRDWTWLPLEWTAL